MKNKNNIVLKIGYDLLKKVEEFINLKEKLFIYINKKQFINIVVADYLRRKEEING